MKPKRIKIRGQMWTLRYAERGELKRNEHGLCDMRKRLVLVKPGLPRANETGVVIHELLHAEQWDLDEEAVERMELTLMKGLRAFGLLKQDDDD